MAALTEEDIRGLQTTLRELQESVGNLMATSAQLQNNLQAEQANRIQAKARFALELQGARQDAANAQAAALLEEEKAEQAPSTKKSKGKKKKGKKKGKQHHHQAVPETSEASAGESDMKHVQLAERSSGAGAQPRSTEDP